MTVYVDNARISATVGRHSSQWSHLFADTQEELHEFAKHLGLKRSYFQPGRPLAGKPSPYWHYDVTEGKRQQAIKMGAKTVEYREAAKIMRDIDQRNSEEPK